MFPNVRAEMARLNYNIATLANKADMKYSTLQTKLKGERPFTIEEAIRIKNALKADMYIEELFAKED